MSAGLRHRRLQELFTAACELEAVKRDEFLHEACADDPSLRADLAALLAHDRRPRKDIESAVGGGAARALARELAESGAPEIAPLPQPVPETIGGFDVLGVIGEGGMGVVYEAWQREPRRRVAIKVIRPGMVTRGLLQRFRHEAQVLAQLEHPGIARIYETGTDDRGQGGQPFFAMELVRGRQLLDYAQAEGLGTRERLGLVAKVCDALHHAHQKGVIHRDLKPANIVIDESGQPKVLDFGVARASDADIQTVTLHTGVGQLVGTVPYMSPEQASGDPAKIDIRSDVYSIGVIAFELLTGRLPYQVQGKMIHEAVRVIREQEPSRLSSIDRSLRGDVETIVAKALAKEPDRRYQSAAELSADIRRFLADEPVVARPASSFYQIRKFARRNRALVGGIFATVIVSIAGAAVAGRYAVIAHRNAGTVALKEQASRRQSYVANLAAAEAALRDGEYRSARRYLDDAPAEHRGWEWRHLASRLHQHIGEWATDGPVVQSPVLDAAGLRLYAVLEGNRIGAWDTATGAFLGSAAPAVDEPRELTLDGPAGRYAAITGDGGLVIGDLASGEIIERPSLPRPAEQILAWHPSGDPMAITIGRRTWVVQDGAARTLDVNWTRGAFLGDGDRFACGYRSATLHEAISGALLAERDLDDQVTVLKAARDSSSIVVGGIWRNVVRLDAGTLEVTRRYLGHLDRINDLALPTGGGLVSTSTDGTLRVWDDAEGRATAVYDAHSAAAYCAALPDGRVLSLGERILEFDPRGPSEGVLRAHQSFVYYVTFSPDGSRLASTGWQEDVVHVWDPLKATLITSLPAARTTTHLGSDMDAVPSVAFSSDGRRIVTGTRPATENRDIATGAGLAVPDIAASEERFLATVGRTASVRVTATSVYGADGRTSGDLPFEIEPGCTARSFSPDGTRFAACFTDKVEIYGLAAGRNLGTLHGHSGKVYCAEFSPDGTRIATGGNDATVRIWDARTFEQLVVLSGHEQYVKTLAWSPDGRMLASGSGDFTVRVWDSDARDPSRRRRPRPRRLTR